MTNILQQGQYLARMAKGPADVAAAQELRHLCFFALGGGNVLAAGRDIDQFDPLCEHVLIKNANTGQLVCCFRLMALPDGSVMHQTYAAAHYDLSGWAKIAKPLAEMGRFCIHPAARDADVLRVAWGALARFVLENRISMLFGCASFAGTKPEIYRHGFALLGQRHQGPMGLTPLASAQEIVRFEVDTSADKRVGLRQLPPLLRSYLAMGGWVGDHAVVDRLLNTLHVFTALDVSAIPLARVKSLQAMAE